jgi:hypothetical protein
MPPLRAEEMMRDLLQQPRVVQHLVQQHREWQPLAEALLRVGPEDKMPTGKQLQQQLGIAASTYRRWLEALYAAYLHRLETSADAIAFPQAEHQLILTGTRASQVFRCRLPVTPRVGEQLELDFLRAVTGESMFYVERLIHDFSEGRYLIRVYLNAGYYNAYLHQLRQRAHFDQLLSLQAEFAVPDYLLERFLRERYPPPPESAGASDLLEQVEDHYGSRAGVRPRRPKARRS